MFQRLTIIGRVGQEPQMRYTPDGAPVTSFSVATTERISKQTPNGERPCPQGWKESYNGRHWEITTWWNITCWRGLAETTNRYLSKGRLVQVEGTVKGEAEGGTLRPRVWTGNDGVSRASFELTARNVLFLGGGGDNGAAPGQEEEEGDELPF